MGPLLTTFIFLLAFPLWIRWVPVCKDGVYLLKLIPNWFLDKDTGVPLILRLIGNFFT